MTVYPTYIPGVLSYDKYSYPWEPSAGRFPASVQSFSYPSGTQEGDPIVMAMSYGTGTPSPQILKQTYATGVESGGATASNGSSIGFWGLVAGDEAGVTIVFKNGVGNPIAATTLFWIIRLDGSSNVPEDLTFAGPRYQYWDFFVASEGDDHVIFPSTDYTFNPGPITPLDTPAFDGVPDGTDVVPGRWFEGMVLDTPYTGGDDSVALPSTPSGWTLLDSDTYQTGSLVDTVAIYHRAETSASVTFPSTTVAVPYHVGAGDVAHFLDYDYNAGGNYWGILVTPM